ncbi:Uncharacterised protein [Bordetella pertussis]|nr:Uncharacterised protein [Bordetella pertussis]CFU06716.1 Uncharacterised protein [Bordetella pertussis]CFW44838.1 Uncharacterised protein [Bordetella pertussis]
MRSSSSILPRSSSTMSRPTMALPPSARRDRLTPTWRVEKNT